ncbi:MAG: condensation domain-containing protein, partial [Caldilinea sp.]
VAYLVEAAPGLLPADPRERVAALRSHLQRRLPDYMVPSAFVWLEALPLTPNGKVDRRALPTPSDVGAPSAPVANMALTPAEAVLAAIWQQVLRLPQVGVDDNFFTIGGDSILSIQIVARARQAGLQIRPRQIFEYQTMRQLAAVAVAAPLSTAVQEEVTGELPLTPIQRWFLEQGWAEAHHFNQAMLVEVAPGLHILSLQEALTDLLTHHDALRLRFVHTDGLWQQGNAPATERADLRVFDFSALTPEQRSLRLAEEADRVQTRLHLAEGPLLRACYFQYGGQEPGRLLLVIHHLAVDGVSWRILLEDLQTAYAQRSQGVPVQLPAKTTAFRDWARWLAQEGVEQLREEREYWKKVVDRCTVRLPVDAPEALLSNTVGSTEEVQSRLDAAATSALLQQTPAAYRTQVNDLLLAALARAVGDWSEESRVVLELEGHGREIVEETLDLSRTVGWFTSLFPVVLDADEPEPGRLICSVKEQLRRIPHRGLGYGVLRFLAAEEELVPTAPVALSFNYLGQFDPALQTGSFLVGMAAEGSGQPHSPAGLRSHLLAVDAIVVNGELQVSWRFSHALHRRSSIEALAAAYLAALRRLIEHCCSTAGGFTPSDFAARGLEQADLDRWFEHYGQEVEEIYELSPMQEGMLFESLYAPESGVYVTQLCFTLDRRVDASALRQGWQELVDRHPILRTLFVWQQGPWQLVLRSAAVPWVEEHWAEGIDEEASLQRWLEADRRRGFVLDQPPLMRCALLRGAGESVYLVWTSHHLIGDGWSLPILLQELLACYGALRRGNRPALPTPRPYRDYILWLRRQARGEASAFWQRQVASFTAPTPLGVDRPASARGTESGWYATYHHSLDPEVAGALGQLGQELRVTLNTFVQGAWALLLHRYSGEEKVLFGATVSGRPATLPGVEQMVGLFINTVPMAVEIDKDAPLADWLRQLQQRQAEAQEYSYLTLAEIQRWSGIPSGTSFFESLLVFENYPVESAALEQEENLLKGLSSHEQTNYPLTVASVPQREAGGSGLHFVVSYDTRRLDGGSIVRMMGHLETLLRGMAEQPQRALAELPLLTAAERHQLLV